MLLIILAALTIAINVTAFFVKNSDTPTDITKSLVLFGTSIIAWLILTFLLVLFAINTYPGTFVPTAAGLFGLVMVIINTIMLVIPLMGRARSSADEAYNADRERILTNIRKVTRSKSKKDWWE
jgi:hypothetical protein